MQVRLLSSFLLDPCAIRAYDILTADGRIFYDLTVRSQVKPLAGILSPGILYHGPVGLKIIPLGTEHLPSGYHLSFRIKTKVSRIDRVDRSDSLRSVSELISPTAVIRNPVSGSCLLPCGCGSGFLCVYILITIVQHQLCIRIMGTS